MNSSRIAEQKPMKDAETERAIALIWRPTISAIVERFSMNDFGVRGLPGVELREADVADQMSGYVDDYGETLILLPEESWATSVSLWMNGYWGALIDLWTKESGRSDLVLHLRIFESGADYRFQVDGIWVP